jgi:hypothetical protein
MEAVVRKFSVAAYTVPLFRKFSFLLDLFLEGIIIQQEKAN